MTCERWLGIDFSGNDAMWRHGCTRSNVWIADVRPGPGLPILRGLVRVQDLPGSEPPFNRLASLLAGGDFLSAAIDAPFSLPAGFVQRVGGHRALLDLVGSVVSPGRNFQRGGALVELVAGVVPPLDPKKPLRATEESWRKLGVNVRSTLWAGARGGAPMTAACLALLHLARRPLWPWSFDEPGNLAEAFPAAQLQTWGLPFEGYNGATASAVARRSEILRFLAQRVDLGPWSKTLLSSADALDAVLCAFAAICRHAPPAGALAAIRLEGWIATSP